MAKQVKPLPVTVASAVGAASLPMQLSADEPGKPVDDGPSAWAPALTEFWLGPGPVPSKKIDTSFQKAGKCDAVCFANVKKALYLPLNQSIPTGKVFISNKLKQTPMKLLLHGLQRE